MGCGCLRIVGLNCWLDFLPKSSGRMGSASCLVSLVGILDSWDRVLYLTAGGTVSSFHALAGQQARAQDTHGTLIGDLNQARVYTEFPDQTRPLVFFYKWGLSSHVLWLTSLRRQAEAFIQQ